MNQMSWCPPQLPECGPPGGLAGLEQCWNDVAAVEALLIKIINDILARDPNAFGQVGALKGVIDGSIAPPGAVGELIAFGTGAPGQAPDVAFPANTVASVALTTMGTLPAGDWNIQAWMVSSVPIDAIQLDNVPTTNLSLTAAQENALIPPGMGWMGVVMGVTSSGTVTTESPAISTLVSFYRGAGPVAIILRTIVDSDVAAGVLGLGFLARRMR
jgi:hypothetical protein